MRANSTIHSILVIACAGIALIGFRFATQAGQGLGVVQNDGYAMSGGFLILLSGMIGGWLLKSELEGKNKK